MLWSSRSRRSLVALGPLGVAVAAGCGGGATSTIDPQGQDAGADAAAADAGSDSAAVLDGSGGADAGACPTYGQNDKLCVDVSECAMVASGCYCGQQPVIGIKKAVLSAATACESKARDTCALGCANMPGQLAEDGTSDQDGGAIEVACVIHQCTTVVR